MCGIAGALGGAASEVRVADMACALAHRGPDATGLASLEAVDGRRVGAFGHRRLSILDLSAAADQPIPSADGRHVIVFNGEIYNFRELRSELAAAGERFRTTGDTEVVLLGWRRFGSPFFARLRGMFALAIWDRATGRAVVARDVFGIKPLYLFERDGCVLFASEVRALLRSGLVPRRLSPAAVATYLRTGSVAEPATILDGVVTLPPGSAAEILVTDGRARISPPSIFATLPEPAPEGERDASRAAGIVREALLDSVRHHLVSDVPVGLFLSGGIDSSIVVAAARTVSDASLATFTVTFEEQGFDEAAPAAAVARRFGTRHHESLLTGEQLLAMLPAAFGAMDQPSMDGLNTYAVSAAVRQHGMKVVLSGLGGDEMFAGYPSFRRALALARVWRATSPARRVAAALGARAGGVRGEKLALLASGESPALAAYEASRALFGERQARELAGGRSESARGIAAPPALSPLRQVGWYELTGYMRNTLLRDSDVFSMAHSLELRVPFVDIGVATAVAAIDESLFLRGRGSKPLLVAAMDDLLPREVWDRPKQGFALPFAHWLRGPLQGLVERELSGPGVAAAGLRPDAVRAVWTDFRRGRGGISWSRPWALYTIVRWARENEVALDASDVSPPLARAAG